MVLKRELGKKRGGTEKCEGNKKRRGISRKRQENWRKRQRTGEKGEGELWGRGAELSDRGTLKSNQTQTMGKEWVKTSLEKQGWSWTGRVEPGLSLGRSNSFEAKRRSVRPVQNSKSAAGISPWPEPEARAKAEAGIKQRQISKRVINGYGDNQQTNRTEPHRKQETGNRKNGDCWGRSRPKTPAGAVGAGPAGQANADQSPWPIRGRPRAPAPANAAPAADFVGATGQWSPLLEGG